MELTDIEEIVYNKIKTTYPASLIAQYPDIKFTTRDRDLVNPKFPLVYIRLLPSSEIGGDLGGDSTNGIDATFEVQVIDNAGQLRAKTIINEVTKIMKAMCFRVIRFPTFDNGDSTYRSISRYQRIIGANDTI